MKDINSSRSALDDVKMRPNRRDVSFEGKERIRDEKMRRSQGSARTKSWVIKNCAKRGGGKRKNQEDKNNVKKYRNDCKQAYRYKHGWNKRIQRKGKIKKTKALGHQKNYGNI